MRPFIWRVWLVALMSILSGGKVCGQNAGLIFSTMGSNWAIPWYFGNYGTSTLLMTTEDPSLRFGLGVYVGNTPLTGTGFTAQLWGNPQGSGLASAPLATTPFRPAGALAGLLQPYPFAVMIPGATNGQRVEVELRVWDNRAGTITTWAQVMADPTVSHGTSERFTTEPLGELPVTLQGMKSHCLDADGNSVWLSLPILSVSTSGLYKYTRRLVFEGETVTLKVEVPDPASSIQWRFQGVNLPGETNQSLVLANVVAGQAGSYSAAAVRLIANRPWSGTNSIALQIVPRPKFGGVQLSSLGDFNARFEGMTDRTAIVEKSLDLAQWSQVQTQWVGFDYRCNCFPVRSFTNRSPAGLAEFYRLRVIP